MFKLRHIQQAVPLLQCGRGRGGNSRVGGVVWLDWDREFKAIEGLNQIVGHTPGDGVRTVMLRDDTGLIVSANYNIDTHLNHVILVMEDGTFQIERV